MSERKMDISKELAIISAIIASAISENKAIRYFLMRRHNKNRLNALMWERIRIYLWIIIERILYSFDGIDEIKSNVNEQQDLNEFTNLIFDTIVECSEMKDYIRGLEKNRLDALSNVFIDIITNVLINNVVTHDQRVIKKLNIIIRDTTKSALQERRAPRQSIDGKVLTENEKAFEEYCAERFDEEDWLKKYKIMLEPLEPEEKPKKRTKKNVNPLLYSI